MFPSQPRKRLRTPSRRHPPRHPFSGATTSSSRFAAATAGMTPKTGGSSTVCFDLPLVEWGFFPWAPELRCSDSRLRDRSRRAPSWRPAGGALRGRPAGLLVLTAGDPKEESLTYYNSNHNRDLVRIHGETAARLRVIRDDYLIERGRQVLASRGRDETTASQEELALAYSQAQAEFEATVEAVERR